MKYIQIHRTKKNVKKAIHKISLIFLILGIALSTCSCSAVKGLITQIPLFEEADIDALADKAETAWDEVGKDALKDAVEDAANTLLGNEEMLSWPQSNATKDIPPVDTGIISKIIEKNSITEITIKEFSENSYGEYLNLLSEELGNSISNGIYRYDDRLISAVYDSDDSVLIITISFIKHNTEESQEPLSEATSEVSSNIN